MKFNAHLIFFSTNPYPSPLFPVTSLFSSGISLWGAPNVFEL